MKIIIEKKLCEFVPKGYWAGHDQYKIDMPSESEFNGYHTYVNLHEMIVGKGKYNQISTHESSIFELIKTERDVGKRYKRPKIKANEFAAIFEQIETAKRKKIEEGKLWAVNYPIYNDKGSESYRVMNFGYVNDAWLYIVDSIERKRISAPGLVMLKAVTLDEVKEFKENQRQHIENQRCLDMLEERKRRFEELRNKELPQYCQDLHLYENKLVELYGDAISRAKVDVIKSANYCDEFDMLYEERMAEREEKCKIEPLNVTRETKKAVMVTMDSREFWLPKSAIKLSDGGNEVVEAKETFIGKHKMKKLNLENAVVSLAESYGFANPNVAAKNAMVFLQDSPSMPIKKEKVVKEMHKGK